MGKQLSEETKQKIRDSFTAKRLAKEEAKKNPRTSNSRVDVIYVAEDDEARIIEMGHLIQDGKMKKIGYATEHFMYQKI